MPSFIEPSDPAADADTNCQICGRDVVEDCICPECPVCQATGDPACILEHDYGPIVTASAQQSGVKAVRNAVFNIEREDKHLEWQLALNRAELEIAKLTGVQETKSEVLVSRDKAAKHSGTLKLYMWSIDPGSSPRLEFAVAGDSDEARDMITADGREYLREYLGIRYKVAELDPPFAFYITCDG